jgi:hypothetical protein
MEIDQAPNYEGAQRMGEEIYPEYCFSNIFILFLSIPNGKYY